MRVIGITGTIGSGKSTVCRILRELGCPVIDADLEAHLSYAPDTSTYKEIVSIFGERILDSIGNIDRSSLGEIVFADPQARKRLNSIVHPATLRRVVSSLRQFAAAGHEWAAVEATLLIEAGWQDVVDQLWVVAAPDDSVVARLRRDRNQDEDHVRTRMSAQMPVLQMMEHADEIIYNDGDLDALRTRVESLWSRLPRPTSPRDT
jgi:dephospho-CoA kinase